MTPEQFIAVARCVDTPMLLVDRGGQILAANSAVCSALGRSQKELIGANVSLVIDDSADVIEDFLRSCSRSREQTPRRLKLNCNEGSAVDYLFEGYLADPKSGDQLAVLVLRFRPIAIVRQSFLELNQKIVQLTKEVALRRRLEAERSLLLASEQASRLLAEQASRTKDEFLAVVSHELRAPLNVFKGWVDLLIAGEVEDGELPEIYMVLQRNCDHQVRLIEDLLETSRVITGNLKLEMASVNLATIVESACQAIRSMADAKGVDLFVSVSPTVGTVSGDPDRLRQVVWNLLTNAIKFSAKSGRVFVALKRASSRVEVKITDDGEGIDAAFLPHVFERFRQEDGTKTRPHGGLGLGLAIVRHIVELHGGTVCATSEGKGKGASFTVSLPLQAVNIGTKFAAGTLNQSPADHSDSQPSPSSPPAALAGLRILVVDDEPDARQLVARILKRQGAEVTTAASAQDALNSIAAGKFDLLLSDIGMPDETGYDLIRQIRLLEVETAHKIPAAALTGFAGFADRELALSAGFHEHLTKPVNAKRLIQVAASLGRRPQSS